MRAVSLRFRWFVLAYLVVAGTPGMAQTAKRPTHPTFDEMVEQHFPQWDRDHNSRFDAVEVNHWMGVRQVHGPHAAALATVCSRMRALPNRDRQRFAIRQAELLVPEGEGPITKPADPATGKKEHRFSFRHEYARLLRELNDYSPRLFANEVPDFRLLKQGPIGDCFFFCITGVLAAKNPKRLVSMIEPEAKGGYLVKFGLHSIQIHEPTDAEAVLCNSASTLKDGHWVIVLEEALGRVLAETKKDGKRIIEMTEMIAFGGQSGRVMEIYSGHHVTNIRLREPEHERERLPALRRELEMTLGHNRLVGVGMNSLKGTSQAKTPGLGYNHAYGVLAFDSKSDKVTVWNPWGNTFKPKGPEGPQHGYATKNGVFEVPLREMYEVFSVAHFETDKKLTSPAKHTSHPAGRP